MSYTKTQWNNDTAPAINETNLNKIEQGIYDNDSHIGDLSVLTTTANTDLVSAINENVSSIGDLSDLETTTQTDIVSAVNEVNSKENGIIKEVIENNKFLKLFTLQFTANWKSTSVYFTLTNIQNNTFSQLINLYIRRDNTATTITNFSCISYTGNLKSDLVAVITDSYTVEVYYKCHSSDSPALNILANPNRYLNITVDMETLVTALPTGTAKYVSDLKVANSTLWNNYTNDIATENNTSTWIPIMQNEKMQHTTISSIVDRGSAISTTGKLTLLSNYFSTVDINQVYKSGHVVEVSFRGLLANKVPNNTSFLRLPYATANNLTLTIGVGGQYQYDATNGQRWAYVGANNTEFRGPMLEAGKWIHINWTYLTNS